MLLRGIIVAIHRLGFGERMSPQENAGSGDAIQPDVLTTNGGCHGYMYETAVCKVRPVLFAFRSPTLQGRNPPQYGPIIPAISRDAGFGADFLCPSITSRYFRPDPVLNNTTESS